jgi:hypothetical protein
MAEIIDHGKSIEIVLGTESFEYQKGTKEFSIKDDVLIIMQATTEIKKPIHQIPISEITNPVHTGAADLRAKLRAFFFRDLSTGSGESAYDLWLSEGNNGTMEDFLNSLNQTFIVNTW